jgi:UDP-glucose 4-epimerase
MLGSTLAATVSGRTGSVMTEKIDWAGERSGADLTAGLDHLVDAVQSAGSPWRIAWCAGAGVTGTPAAVLDREVAVLFGFLDELAARHDRLGPGTLFLASSAGGIYAGTAGGGPFSELHGPMPISDYGTAKLACEQAVTRYAERSGNLTMIGRISNLYGPGQNMSKAQGLISHLCRASISRQPISIYVSLDTIRDYLYVEDCAAMIADMLDSDPPLGCSPGQPLTKVLAAQQGTSIASLIAVCRQVFKRPPLLILGSSAAARFQVRDLRLKSVVWPEIDHRTLRSLPSGIAATLAGTLRSVQRAQ